ncbi:MAG: exo-beta-N-acetylmuramidase NamZ family protein [Calditrichia bacterium]
MIFPRALILPILILLLSFACQKSIDSSTVKSGLDNLDEHAALFAGKRVGIITNHTAYDKQGMHIVDRFAAIEGVTISALFGPEHGIRGSVEAGKKIDSENDPLRDVPVYSLYGKTRKPTPEMLENVDILVFDIQDIGARFYTYIYTMSNAMEAAAEQGKPFVVLDRPNPINGLTVEGNILETQFSTFVGKFPIPVRHGMSVGELAKMFSEAGWLGDGVKADLTIIKMSNWQRNQWFDETALNFINPSPNMPGLASATVYPGTCLLEGIKINEGRGTSTPFLIFGAPWTNSDTLADRLSLLKLSGVQFLPYKYKPISIPGASANPRYRDENCNGVQIKITDRDRFESYFTGIAIVHTLHTLYADSITWHERHFDRLCGTDEIRRAILANRPLSELRTISEKGLSRFKRERENFLLYK